MGNRAYKQHHREIGLCVDCLETAQPYSTRCARHNDLIRRYCRIHDADRKGQRVTLGRCYACGREREDVDISMGGKLCLNCNETWQITGGKI
jgi:hypothetical protein